MSQASESPLEHMYRRRPSFTRPPIRDVHSPRLTPDEADLLTSPFLNYSTGYTYAFSQSYNPDKPPAWEVPNINNNFLHIANQEYVEHAVAPSIVRKVGQASANAFWTMINTVLWALYCVTLRPLELAGLLLYDTAMGAVYLARRLGESISDCVYEQIGEYRQLYRRRSIPDIVIIAVFKLFYGIFSILRLPVDLVCHVFRDIGLALSRKYYEIVAANRRRINQQLMLAKLKKINRGTAELTRWELMRKAEQEAAEKYEFHGARYDPNDPNDPDRRFYNLRSRNICAFDTDSDDDEIVPRRRKTVRFDTTPTQVIYDGGDFRRVSMAYRIATWLGSTASSVVYYLLYGAHLAVLCVKRPYDFITGKTHINFVTPSNSEEEVILVGRHPYRRHISSGDDEYAEGNYDMYAESEPPPLLMSKFTSFCSNVLYAPCRAFLFVAFAVVDLIRWLHSRVYGLLVWLGNSSSYLASMLYNRRRRWLWWILPLFLLLLLLLFPKHNNDPVVIFGHRVSDMPEKVKSYFMDSEGVYAKSLNSIYDEYWRSGKFGKYGVLTRISSAFSNAWFFVYTLAKTVYDLLNNIVSDVISYVVDFFKWPFKWSYSKLPLVPSFTMPGLEKSEWSYSVSPTHLTRYLPHAPNMSFLKDSTMGLVYNAERCFYDFFTSLRTGGMLITNGLQQLALALLDMIAYPFEKLSSGVPKLSSLKTSALAVGNTAEKYLHSGLLTLAGVGHTMVSNLVDWVRLVWQGVSVLFLLITSPFQRHRVTVIDQKPDELKIETIAPAVPPATPIAPATNIVYVPSPVPTTPIDEKKLIEKITAIVRAKMDQDLKSKLETELTSLKASYEEKISSLQAEKAHVDVDYTHLESLIRAAIYEYDSDKTGMFDFALESAGASIISTRCSENYNTYSRLEKIWNIPLWYSSYGPRTVIQRNSKTLFPGECWSFKGPVGYITIGLSHPINMTIFSYEHIGAHQAPGGERPSCPKTFKLWAYKSEADLNTRVLLGDFTYDIKGAPLQFFVIKTQPDYPVKIIEMEVTSNYGAEYTSLYRLRVHGSLWKPGSE